MEKLLLPNEVADYLRVHVQTVWMWAREGSIPCIKIGNGYRFKQEEIDNWLENKRQKDVLGVNRYQL